MATADKMLRDMRKLGIALPEVGSGRGGKILNSDLEHTLAIYYAALEDNDSWSWHARLALREVMLSYRYDKLPESSQEYAMQDGNEWLAEEKYDGCRIVVGYDPDTGFHFYGRNRSRATYLPIDYTDKILIKGRHPSEYTHVFPFNVLFDAELITDGYIETQGGNFTGAPLNAVSAILQLDEAESKLAQKTTAPLQCVLFDFIPMQYNFQLNTKAAEASFAHRRAALQGFYWAISMELGGSLFKLSKVIATGKKAFLDKLLAEGKEGIILKNRDAMYVPGLNGIRDRNACIKVKRTMTGALGDEIDAYIIGYTNGDEWDKVDRIAGLKLAVKLRNPDGELREHWIATVSGIPNDMRDRLSYLGPDDHRASLAPEHYGKVLAIDGQDISARNRRIAHAKVDWSKGFRADKTPEMCIMDEEFIDSQLF